ncbi:MAG: HIT domain-containing protein [Sedimentisphaerales bacterium]|nr:HIT domain-containing protein [Sedimentisphaerales bacterium]
MDQRDLWAPWRIGYIQDAAGKAGGCFLCKCIQQPQKAKENLEVWRTGSSIVVLNRFPYNNGHLLIAPLRHIGGLLETSDQELQDILVQVKKAQLLLDQVLKPQGYNIGINLGRCAGAGLADHLHIHVVPRWNGDTNFMSVCGDTKVISQSLQELWEQLVSAAGKADRPGAV